MTIPNELLCSSRPFNIISLFAGAGGSAIGFQNAGFKHLLLNDNNGDCVKTLRDNLTEDANVIHDHVKNLSFINYSGQVDVLEGGFPCQSFSYAGNGLGTGDPRGTLFNELVRCMSECSPRIVMAENVKGLINHDRGKTLRTIVQAMTDVGYNTRFKLLNAQGFDVPQKRERLFIVASKSKRFLTEFNFPQDNMLRTTLGEALLDCPKSVSYTTYSPRKTEIMDLVPEGGCWKDLPDGIREEYMGGAIHSGGGKTGMARRLCWNKPSPTILCSTSQKMTEMCHPKETRPLTVRECARIQTFPDSWHFHGSVSSQQKQVGNAVPCNLAYHMAVQIRKFLEEK